MYIALPNSMHAEFTIRAANAGVHVLCEKPLAVTADECQQMIDACREAGVKLMTAYRLHFEPVNLKAIDLVRQGRLGEPKYFNSSFSMRVRPGDIRTRRDTGGGTLYDIGVYCINAARYLFRAEPMEVMAISVNSVPETLGEIDESTGALLRFEGEKVASFVTSFNAADVATYTIVGTKGRLDVDPAYEYAEGLAYTLTVNGKTTRKRVGRSGISSQRNCSTSPTASSGIARPSRRVRKACRTCVSCRPSTSRRRPARRCRFPRSNGRSGRTGASASNDRP